MPYTSHIIRIQNEGRTNRVRNWQWIFCIEAFSKGTSGSKYGFQRIKINSPLQCHPLQKICAMQMSTGDVISSKLVESISASSSQSSMPTSYRTSSSDNSPARAVVVALWRCRLHQTSPWGTARTLLESVLYTWDVGDTVPTTRLVHTIHEPALLETRSYMSAPGGIHHFWETACQTET